MQQSKANYKWVTEIDDVVARDIVALIDSSVADGGTLGYAEPLSISQAKVFIDGLTQRLADGDCHILLGRNDSQPSFMVVVTQSGMANCRHRAELSKGVVHPAHRGQGLVKHAFRELVRRADELGVEQFILDVREGTRAHQLWTHYGFVSIGVLEDYARVAGTSHRGHFMAQTVDSLRTRVFPSCQS